MNPNYPMFETISVANLLQKLKETQDEEVKSKAIKDFLPTYVMSAFENTMEAIEESSDYGEALCKQYIANGELEKAIAVDKAFMDTRLEPPTQIRVSRPSRFYVVGSSKDWAKNKEMQRHHMKEIYHRAAEEPHNFHLMTQVEMIISMFTIAEQGPLTGTQTDVLLWLCDQTPIGGPEYNHHPDVEMFYEEMRRDMQRKGRDKPSGTREWTKDL